MKNAYEIRGDVVAIFLPRDQGEALIDLADLPLAQAATAGTWTVNSASGRVHADVHRSAVQLHSLIANVGYLEVVSFADGNPLNCRRANVVPSYLLPRNPLEPEKVAEIVAAYGTYLRTIARSLTPDQALQDDLIQLTFIRLWVAPPPDFSEIGGWLARTLRHRYYDYRTRGSTKMAALSEPGADEDAYGAEQRRSMQPETALEQAESDAAVHAALACLTHDERSILTRFYFENEGCEAIGATYGLSRAGGKSRLQRARKAFKQAYLSLFGEPWKEEVYAA